MKTIILSVLALTLVGCAKNTNPNTPPAPTTVVQFVGYADIAVTDAEFAVSLIPNLSASDQQLAQTLISDLGQTVTCVANAASSTDPAAVKIEKTSACLSSLKIPPEAGPQVTAIVRGAFLAIQTFFAAYQAQNPAAQAATVAAITPAATRPLVARAQKLVH